MYEDIKVMKVAFETINRSVLKVSNFENLGFYNVSINYIYKLNFSFWNCPQRENKKFLK